MYSHLFSKACKYMELTTIFEIFSILLLTKYSYLMVLLILFKMKLDSHFDAFKPMLPT